ncbi:MAG: hypothetical protein PHF84_00240 [bacterium]|nr:hypothetical protein [bacterium]
MPHAWKALALVYRDINAEYINNKKQVQQLQVSMNDADFQYTLSTLSNFPRTILNWSGGKVVMDLKIVIVDHPIRSLNTNGEPNEYQARQEIDLYNPGRIYDSVEMIYCLRAGVVSGCSSVGLSGTANNAGFSIVHIPVSYKDWGLYYPEEILVHEWLHNVEGYYQGLGYTVPGLHDATVYGYTYDPSTNNTWQHWYKDYMQNKVWDGFQYIGVPPQAWSNYIPTGLVTMSVPGIPVPSEPNNNSTGVSLNTLFRWNTVNQASWYGLQVSSDASFTTKVIDRWIKTNSYACAGLSGSTMYYYRLRAINPAGTNSWSAVYSFTTEAGTEVLNKGKALRFDGKNDHVRIKSLIQDDFTVEAWIKTKASRSGSQVWEGLGLIYADYPGVADDFGTGVVSGKFAFFTGNPDTMIQSVSSVTSGQWTHVAATRVKATGVMKVFVNGVEESRASNMNKNSLTAPVYIDIGGNLLDLRTFDGLMDEVRIWNTARTKDEIMSNMSNQLTGTETGLVGYYCFNEGSGTSALDKSSSGNHGYIRYGPVWQASTAPLVIPAEPEIVPDPEPEKEGPDNTNAAYTHLVIGPNPYKPNDRILSTGTPDTGVIFAGITRDTRIEIYTIAGRLIARLEEKDDDSKLTWHVPDTIASGIYLCRIMDRKGEKAIRKIGIIK